MSIRSRLPRETANELPRELVELGERIASLPVAVRDELDPAYHRVVDSVRRRRRILNLVQESLAQLRLDIKYLIFDLEVTRRERDSLRDQ
ncbi:MAG: transcriptional regulator [Planctomycetaceae bacterium]|nr:transcriptional regulator [Planctomycetaceae bacterium]